MARHWSNFVEVTDRQAYALDAMADENNKGDGLDILRETLAESQDKETASKYQVQKLEGYPLRKLIDACFKKYGRA
jgi:hypothetical protein